MSYEIRKYNPTGMVWKYICTYLLDIHIYIYLYICIKQDLHRRPKKYRDKCFIWNTKIQPYTAQQAWYVNMYIYIHVGLFCRSLLLVSSVGLGFSQETQQVSRQMFHVKYENTTQQAWYLKIYVHIYIIKRDLPKDATTIETYVSYEIRKYYPIFLMYMYTYMYIHVHIYIRVYIIKRDPTTIETYVSYEIRTYYPKRLV